MSGWIPMQRDRFDQDFGPSSAKNPWCDGYAWDWMVAQAAYSERKMSRMSGGWPLDIGQFSHSTRFMAEKFNWSQSKVVRFLKRLKTASLIETETASGQVIVTICNYVEKYTASEAGGSVSGSLDGSEAVQKRFTSGSKNKKEKRKEGNKGKGDDDLFGEKPKRTASHFPEDWKPSQRTVDGLTEKGFTAEQIEDEAGRCADFHRSKGNTFKDHNGAFRNWMRNDLVQERKRQREATEGIGANLSTRARAIMYRRKLLDEQQAKRDAADLRGQRQ